VALSGKSETRTLQRIGRLVRPYPGKGVAIAFDIWDSAESSYKQGEARKKLYETELYWRIEVMEMR
jgi:superfamily II DNA or RNA helicase